MLPSTAECYCKQFSLESLRIGFLHMKSVTLLHTQSCSTMQPSGYIVVEMVARMRMDVHLIRSTRYICMTTFLEMVLSSKWRV